MPDKLAFNQVEAAHLCGISVTTLWRDTKLGKVRRTTRGVYPRSELERYLRSDLIDGEFVAKKQAIRRNKRGLGRCQDCS